MIEIIATDNAPAAAGPYSQAVKEGNMLFCSGQIALDPSSGTPARSCVAVSALPKGALVEVEVIAVIRK